MRPLFSWTKDREPRGGSARNGVRTLLISGDGQYTRHWQSIFGGQGWDLECAATLDGALQALDARRTPIVVYDWQAETDEDWRDVVHSLAGLPQRPCVLVASSVIDEGLRDEVVRLHGYDVLRRQANEEEITRTINSAWFWKHRDA